MWIFLQNPLLLHLLRQYCIKGHGSPVPPAPSALTILCFIQYSERIFSYQALNLCKGEILWNCFFQRVLSGTHRPHEVFEVSETEHEFECLCAHFPGENVKRYYQILGLWLRKGLEELSVKDLLITCWYLWPNLSVFPKCWLMVIFLDNVCFPLPYALSSVGRPQEGAQVVNKLFFCLNGGPRG